MVRIRRHATATVAWAWNRRAGVYLDSTGPATEGHMTAARAQLDQRDMAEAQRIAGMVLNYMTKMGVSSTVVEAMSQTRDVRWLSTKDALAMNLITDRVGRTSAR